MADDERTPGPDDGAADGGAASEHDPTVTAGAPEDETIGMPEGPGAPASAIPESIGGYRVLGVLGEGGMGVVYEAEQASPRRRVALKVIRGGHFVDDNQVRMFRREAETLARLRHPNIGAIYESGRTDDGRHFFAMELVQGDTLGAYLAGRPRPATPGELEHRLALFRKICDAVQYAHQRGVIHRDLKPSNIIVTDDHSSSGAASSSTTRSAMPTVKILDFGLARITEEDLAMTQVTEVGVIKGTLPYMAPEQARGDAEAIDIRTDVYALGVILYEMLAGRRPYEAARSALLEAVRVICEEPPAPLGASWSGSRRLDPDVETIVGTALEKDPDRRYASAAALSEDIGRFLESQPILARPPSAVYQLRKMVARHRTAFVASVVVAVVLVASTVVSSSLYLKAKRESERARVAALKSEQVATFMTGMLEGVGPAVAMGRDTTMLREILDRTAERLDAELQGQPEVEASLRDVLGKTYRDLGELEAAEAQLRSAVATNRRVLGDDDPATLISINDLGLTLQDRGAWEEAEALTVEGLEGCRRVLGDDHIETRTAASNYGQLLAETGRFDEAERYHRRAFEDFSRIEGPEDPQTLTAQTNLGILLMRMGRVSESEDILRATLEAKRRVLGNDHPETFISLDALAVVLEGQERFDEAKPLYFESLDACRRVLGDDHPGTLRVLSNIGVFLTKVGRPDEGERYLREALETKRRVFGDDHLNTLVSMNTMGFWYFRQKRYDESEAMVREAVERGRTALGSDHPELLVWVFNLGKLLELRGRAAEAEPYYREVLETRRRVLDPAHPETLYVLSELAKLVDRLGRPGEAEQLLIEGLRTAAAGHGDAGAATVEARARLARFYTAHGRPDDARSVAVEQLEALRAAAEASDEPGPKNAFAWEALTCEPADLQDPDAALAFAREAAELGNRQDPDVLDTLALAHHRTGDHARAVEVQTQALELVGDDDLTRREACEQALEAYRSALED
ncbi:MAG TPA: serine/threonine-protein kinase [Methylomirabilota bacterium]|nr:serine/threonine-protein kinase [Methylomirabilota bacterium]